MVIGQWSISIMTNSIVSIRATDLAMLASLKSFVSRDPLTVILVLKIRCTGASSTFQPFVSTPFVSLKPCFDVRQKKFFHSQLGSHYQEGAD